MEATQTPAVTVETAQKKGPSYHSKKLAREWLEQWGADVRERNNVHDKFRQLYATNQRDGLPITPKAVNDPSAALFKHCTVEAAITRLAPGGRTGVRYLAEHLWVKGEPLSRYHESGIEAALKAYGKSDHAIFKWLEGVREAIVEAVAEAIEETYSVMLKRVPGQRSEVN